MSVKNILIKTLILDFCLLTIIKARDPPKLKIFLNGYLKDEVNIFVLTPLKETEIYKFNGILFYLSNNDDIKKLIKLNKYYNRKWILCTNNTNGVLKLIDNIEKSQSNFIKGPIIIPSSIINKINNFTQFKLAKIFYVEDYIFEYLLNYDLFKVKNNTSFSIEANLPKYLFPVRYLNILILITIILLSFCILVWKKEYTKYFIENPFILSKVVIIFPFLKFFISCLLFYKLKFLTINKKSLSNVRDFWNLMLLSTNLMFKTILWFFEIFVSEGWGITFQFIGRNQLKFYFRKYAVIYFALCIDEGIDKLYGNSTMKYLPSEIKNLMLCFFLSLIIYLKSSATMREIQRKIFSAQFEFNEFLPSLNLKNKMIKWHIRINIIFFISFTVITSLMNTTYFIKECKEIHYNLIDLILIIGYIWIFLPRNFPPFFFDDIKGDLKNYNNIYKVKLPIDTIVKHKDIFQISNIIYPLVILNPSYYACSELKDTKIEKVLLNMKVGFIERKIKEKNKINKKNNLNEFYI